MLCLAYASHSQKIFTFLDAMHRLFYGEYIEELKIYREGIPMDLAEILAPYRMVDQIYLSMFTTTFILLLFVCQKLVKKIEDAAQWMGFYALGIIIAGYGIWLGVYANMLLMQGASLGEIPIETITVMPSIALLVNGIAFLPIALLVIRTMQEEIPKNSKRVARR